MKKYFIALIGLSALMSCNEDTIDSGEKTEDTELVNSTFTYDDNLPNGSTYRSPYDLNSSQPIGITLFNSTMDIDVKLTPLFMLAYWDGADDGILNYGTGAIIPNGTPISSFPNFFYTGSEYDNYSKADEISISPNSIYTFQDDSQNGFAVGNGPNYFFTFNNMGFTQAENDLMRHYGKFMGFYYTFYDNITGAYILDGFVYSHFYTNSSTNGSFNSSLPNWTPITPTINLFGINELIYNNNSSELMMAQNGGYSDDYYVTNPNNGNTYRLKISGNSRSYKASIIQY